MELLTIYESLRIFVFVSILIVYWNGITQEQSYEGMAKVVAFID